MLLTTAYPTMPVGVVAGKAMMDGAWEGHRRELEMLAGQNALHRVPFSSTPPASEIPLRGEHQDYYNKSFTSHLYTRTHRHFSS